MADKTLGNITAASAGDFVATSELYARIGGDSRRVSGTVLADFLATATLDNINVASDGYLRWSTDLYLYRDAANTLALRNGTNIQTFNLYGTHTDASNYERLNVTYNGSRYAFAAQAAGTGTAREMEFLQGSTVSLRIASTTALFNGSVLPFLDNIRDLGGSSSRWKDFYTNSIVTPDAGELTIATGAITVTGTYHTVDTESDAASDDLDTVSGGQDGDILVLQAENTARTVVCKDGTGNLQLAGDFSLDNTQDTIAMIYSGALSAWCELSRSDNGA